MHKRLITYKPFIFVGIVLYLFGGVFLTFKGIEFIHHNFGVYFAIFVFLLFTVAGIMQMLLGILNSCLSFYLSYLKKENAKLDEELNAIKGSDSDEHF